VVVRGRWARVGRLLVCRRTALVMSKYMPLVQPDRNSGACWVVWFRSGIEKKSEALLSAPLRIRDPGRRARLPDHGVRERPIADAGCHATPVAQGSACCGYRENRRRKKQARAHCVCEQRSCAWGVATAGQSSFSQLKLSVVQAKAIFISNVQVACKVVVNAFQQYERLPSLATANIWRRSPILKLAHPPLVANPHEHWGFARWTC